MHRHSVSNRCHELSLLGFSSGSGSGGILENGTKKILSGSDDIDLLHLHVVFLLKEFANEVSQYTTRCSDNAGMRRSPNLFP